MQKLAKHGHFMQQSSPWHWASSLQISGRNQKSLKSSNSNVVIQDRHAEGQRHREAENMERRQYTLVPMAVEGESDPYTISI